MSDVSIVLCGEAGQGIQTVELLFSKIVHKQGLYIFSTKEYMSRVRGGSNSTLIRISTRPVKAYNDRIDLFIPLTSEAITHLKERINEDTIIIGDKTILENIKKHKTFEANFKENARSIGNPLLTNVIAVGMLSSLCDIPIKNVQTEITAFFSDKKDEIIKKNITAVQKGYNLGDKLKRDGLRSFNIATSKRKEETILINGTQAIGLGAIAGGCNFISSYPMSPATGVLTFLSKHAEDFNIIVEQAEDEISAINMALGAWYAGARSLVTTSGGGYALMIEGISLAGMIESPVVVHVAQRPGPATGLPTRTEQADLEHILYSGHGEFPRILYAPGTLEDAFHLTLKAFHLADKYQIPVFVLSDQYFVDSYYQMDMPKTDSIEYKQYFIKTKKDYKRYNLTEDGLSPRGIPGYGEGLLCVDSDEHDQEGCITEDMDTRKKMVEKRLRKTLAFEKEIIPPEFTGSNDYRYLVIGWGSTYHIINEALLRINNKKIGFLHFKQLYPLHKTISEYLNKAETTIIIENNATSQFAKLIKQETGTTIDHHILQYNSLPFSVETIESELRKIIKKEVV
ncbi:MAG: 2-oxoacid:acceptor oxidoreductase subunit alpha [Candidatus Thermoplasmatota archaeon]|nr:2-oxoacid:acceptor oxidoreductase subunit alpha [Candidatus Thermoplasmatota archaeon]